MGNGVDLGSVRISSADTMKLFDAMPKWAREAMSHSWFNWGINQDECEVCQRDGPDQYPLGIATSDKRTAVHLGGMAPCDDHELIVGRSA